MYLTLVGWQQEYYPYAIHYIIYSSLYDEIVRIYENDIFGSVSELD
jgi:hypothetical protein